MTSIVVITAGTSIPSSSRLLGERLGEASVAALAASGSLGQVTHIELRTLATDLANHLATRVPSARLREAFDAVCGADGVIAVTPVFNGSYSGLFKLFFDALDEGVMKGRPVLLAATGGSARHSLVIDHAMLPLFFYLKAVAAPNPVFAATKDWGTEGGKLERRIAKAAQEFARIVRAGTPAKADDDFEVTDFRELLGG
ncbi:CE1759 family FMN reductase [Propionicimonas sp.]|uniref:CE1759 family FMN reductase n=1 Tax=Propionicimonas sp. TaxID=1955623 RepID=UPI0039E4EC5F